VPGTHLEKQPAEEAQGTNSSKACGVGGSVGDFPKTMKDKCARVPSVIKTLVEGLRPYKGGDDVLWSLAGLSAGQRHHFVKPVVAVQNLEFDSGFIPMPSEEGDGPGSSPFGMERKRRARCPICSGNGRSR
jgi:hypothetical protein